MKHALIIGITGCFGHHVATALHQQGYALSTLMRDPARLPGEFDGVRITRGQIEDLNCVRQAAKNADILIYAANPANYDWEGKAVEWLENAIQVAIENQMTLVFPANVYVLNPADGPDFTEHSPLSPIQPLGHIRLLMEQRLQQASLQGVKVIMLRMGDFIGANASSAWAQHLIKPARKHYTVLYPGDPARIHSWAYLPDAANVITSLLDKSAQLPMFNLFHFRGYQINMQQFADAVSRASELPVKLKPFPWWFFRTGSVFSKLFTRLIQMRYLWNEEVNLIDNKLIQTVGPYKQTRLEQALIEAGLVKSVVHQASKEIHPVSE